MSSLTLFFTFLWSVLCGAESAEESSFIYLLFIMLDLDYLLTLEKEKKLIQKDKKLYIIREKMNKTLSFSELLYLRKFCKKH